MEDCRVEIVFEGCHYARLGPCDEDLELACCLGYVTDRPIQDLIFQRAALDYVQAEKQRWRETGICPDPLVYIARQSAWLESLPEWRRNELRHYVVYGRNGYVELIAERATWRDWLVIYEQPESALEAPLAGEGALEPAEFQSPLRVPEFE